MESTYNFQTYGKTPLAILRVVQAHRRLIYKLTARELRARYQGSALGVLWLFLTPLVMLAIYTFVFSQVFKSRWDVQVTSPTDFALVLFLGLILFNLFGEVFARAPSLLLENVSYIKKVVFPLEILAVVAVAVAAVNALICGITLLVFFMISRGLPPLTALLVPLYFIPAALLALGAGWVLSSLGVFVRDLKPVVGLLSMLLLFMSPIFYPLSAVPDKFRPLLTLNPLALIIEDARALLFQGTFPPLDNLLLEFAVGFGCAWLGYIWFMKTKKGFSDVV